MPSKPLSPPAEIKLAMSRNGVARRAPEVSEKILIVPVCSTIKRREASLDGAVMNTGELSPLATDWSFTPVGAGGIDDPEDSPPQPAIDTDHVSSRTSAGGLII